ncbi:MAG: aspartate aminotransferase family protein [Thaumarchaeota archaeon]|nr:aspartate aminotransferase family protein [Nitrososphaerota archaeon]MCZ6616000.1 aspartate aminotransferase family protein [Nitrososphaerota archaeon]
MNEMDVQNVEDGLLAPVYQKFPIEIFKGKDFTVWDKSGKEYLDFMGGYGVAIVGHCNPSVVKAINEQASRLMICHSSMYNEARAIFLRKILDVVPSQMGRVYMSNSGAEAVECALKVAKKYTGRKNIVAMTGSYHGKTFGALSATWNPKYRSSFEPLLPGFSFVPYADSSELEKSVTEETGAVIIEPIQGESGVLMPPEGYLREVRRICDDKGALLIFDEIQSGLGRSGRFWASEHSGVIPDIMCIAKGIAGGVPMGVTVARDDIMASFKLGDHTSTNGGNPLACAAATATLDFIVEKDLVNNAAKMGKLLSSGFSDMGKEHRIIRDSRGQGLMLALELRFEVKPLLMDALKKGLLLLYSGRNILRFLPPLTIGLAQVTRCLEILEEVISAEEKARFN